LGVVSFFWGIILKVYGRDIKLLAVDSETVNLLLLEEALKDKDIDVDCCSVGDKAIELIKKNNYDIVLLDIVMPDMDGFELRKLIRTFDQYLPIIYLTAIIDTVHNDLIEKISADQATYYMKKPFDLDRLLKMIRSVVKNYRSDDKTRKYYTTLEENLNLASEVQHLLLPNWIVMEKDFIMSSIYRPVYKVSGDIFDFTKIGPGRYFVLLGDIAGHGIQAALYMSAIHALVKTVIMVSDYDIKIDDILNRLNRFFCVDMQKKNYMTCLVALFDFNINKLQFISAGHLSFFMHNAKSGEVKLLNPENKGAIPVGWINDYKFNSKTEAVEVDFDDDCSFLGITDGIIEMSNEKDAVLGVENLRLLLEKSVTDTISPVVPYHVCNAIKKAGYTNIEDDICMLMIKKNKIQEDEKNHLQLTTAPNILYTDFLGIECERFIIKNTGDERLAVESELLLNEFLNNIIMHGLEKPQPEGPKILVDLAINDSEVLLKVWDKGKPWTFNTSPITIDENIWDDNNKLATAGRGMAIIKSIAGKIECNRYGDLNETSFVINREG
jgi:phosphoserine phosphatase RsbU/P